MQAIAGLGFAADDPKGPSEEDRYFVGSYYLVWIDQTGFQGKNNAIGQLNGKSATALDFVHYDGNRPFNFVIVGEHGNGVFPALYPGSEHAEFPNRTPEANDNPSSATSDWCNQYAHEEDADFDSDIPWWSSCNGGSITWDTLLLPIAEEHNNNMLYLQWEAPLVKVADGDGNFDADACNEDWIFEDGI